MTMNACFFDNAPYWTTQQQGSAFSFSSRVDLCARAGSNRS